MTKLAILADIHGNLPALEAVWHDLSRHDVDHVVVAGDIINWGPFSLEVLEFLDRHRCSVIRGNNELYVTEYDSGRAPDVWSTYTLPGWTHLQIGDTWRRRVAGWPDTLQLRYPDGPPIRVVHGSPRDHWEGIYEETPDTAISEMLAGIEEAFVIAGHTHLPLDRTSGNWRILNPGTVGVPLDANPLAGYMLLTAVDDTWIPEFYRVPYDRDALFAGFEERRFLEAHGVVGHLIIEEFRTSNIQVDAFIRWRRNHNPDAPESLALLADFTTDIRRSCAPEPYRRYI